MNAPEDRSKALNEHMSSGFAPRADIVAACRHVRFVPIADISSAANCTLLDHLVGAGKKRWRHREAERLAVVRSMTRSNFVEARRMRVCYPSRPSARMVSCTFGLAPIRAMYALMFGHFARSILWILVQLSTVNK